MPGNYLGDVPEEFGTGPGLAIAEDTCSVANGGSFDFTGVLSTVVQAVVEPANQDPGTTVYHRDVSGVSGTQVHVDGWQPDGSASGTADGTGRDTRCIAIGQK